MQKKKKQLGSWSFYFHGMKENLFTDLIDTLKYIETFKKENEYRNATIKNGYYADLSVKKQSLPRLLEEFIEEDKKKPVNERLIIGGGILKINSKIANVFQFNDEKGMEELKSFFETKLNILKKSKATKIQKVFKGFKARKEFQPIKAFKIKEIEKKPEILKFSNIMERVQRKIIKNNKEKDQKIDMIKFRKELFNMYKKMYNLPEDSIKRFEEIGVHQEEVIKQKSKNRVISANK